MIQDDASTSFLGSFPQNSYRWSNHEKNIRETPVKGCSARYLLSNPQICRGHQKQGHSEKLLEPRGASGDMMTTRNGASWRGFGARKMTLGENWITQELCCRSVAKSCLTLCGPMDCSMLGFPVPHQLLEPAQTHVHWISDAIQPSHALSPSTPALNLSQHQDLFKWVGFSHQVAKVLEFQLQHQSFQWIFRTDFL